MDSRYVKKNQVIDRYLMNKLSADELEEFEQYFLENTNLVQEIRLRKRFIGGLQALDRDEILSADSRVPSKTWQWMLLQRPSVAATAIAVSIVLALVSVQLFIQAYRLQQANDMQVRQISQLSSPQANTVLVTLVRTRGSMSDERPVIRIRLSSLVEQVVLALNIESSGHENYRLALSKKGADEFWSQTSIHIPPAVVLQARQLSHGDYHLAIFGQESGGDSERVAHFSFTVLEE